MTAVFTNGRGRHPSAKGGADDDRPGGQLCKHGAQVFDIGTEVIAGIGGPFAFAMAAQVD